MNGKKATPASNGTHETLHVPEILEAILLQLPLKDLLIHAQLVNHEWYSTIQNSARLQQALFFQPSPKTASQASTFNPLLETPFKPWFVTDPDLYSRGRVFTNLIWNKSKSTRAAFMRKEASWRRMLPVQPPPYTFEVVERSSYQIGTRTRKGSVAFPDGVRMGTLYDYGYISVAKPISSFTMEWHRPLEVNHDSDLEAANSAGADRDVVTMAVNWTFQCRRGMPPDVGGEFQSGGFEELHISFGNNVVAT